MLTTPWLKNLRKRSRRSQRSRRSEHGLRAAAVEKLEERALLSGTSIVGYQETLNLATIPHTLGSLDVTDDADDGVIVDNATPTFTATIEATIANMQVSTITHPYELNVLNENGVELGSKEGVAGDSLAGVMVPLTNALQAGENTLRFQFVNTTDPNAPVAAEFPEFCVTVVLTPPSQPTIALQSGSDSGDSNTDRLTNETSPTFDVTGLDTGDAGQTVELLRNNQSLTGGGGAIPDDDFVTSTIEVFQQEELDGSNALVPISTEIRDVQVTVQNLVHSFAGDLQVTLTHLDTGVSVDLVNRLGRVAAGFGDNSNYGADYTFDDGATGDLAAAAATGDTTFVIPGGSYFPTTADGVGSSLDAFRVAGDTVVGMWELRITDHAAGDTGSFDGWTLEFNRDALDDTMNGASSTAELTDPTVGEGNHSYTARVTTSAGGTAVTDLLVVTVDTTPPAAPDTPDLQDASDTGDDNSDEVTFDTTPTFDITSVLANVSIILVRRDENGLNPTDVRSVATGANGAGTASLTDTGRIADGTYIYSAVQQDAAGNRAESGGLTVTIDTSTAEPTQGAPGTPVFTEVFDSASDLLDNIKPWTASFDKSTQTFWFTLEDGDGIGQFDPATQALKLYDVSLGGAATNTHGTFFDFDRHILPRVWFTMRNRTNNAALNGLPRLSYFDLAANELVTYDLTDAFTANGLESDQGFHAVAVDDTGSVWVSAEHGNLLVELRFDQVDPVTGAIDINSRIARVIVHRTDTDHHLTEDNSRAQLRTPHGLRVVTDETTGERFVWITKRGPSRTGTDDFNGGRIMLLRPGAGTAGQDLWHEWNFDEFLTEEGDRGGHALFIDVDDNETPGIPQDDFVVMTDPGLIGRESAVRILDPRGLFEPGANVTDSPVLSFAVPVIPRTSTSDPGRTNQPFVDRSGTVYVVDRTGAAVRIDPNEDSFIREEDTVPVVSFESPAELLTEGAAPDVLAGDPLLTDVNDIVGTAQPSEDLSPVEGLDQYMVPNDPGDQFQGPFRAALSAGNVLFSSLAQDDQLAITVFAEAARKTMSAVPDPSPVPPGTLTIGRMAFQVMNNGSVVMTARRHGQILDDQVNLTAELLDGGFDLDDLLIDGDTTTVTSGRDFVHTFGKHGDGTSLVEYRGDLRNGTWSSTRTDLSTFADYPAGELLAGEPVVFATDPNTPGQQLSGVLVTTSSGRLLLFRPNANELIDLSANAEVNDPQAVTTRVFASPGVIVDGQTMFVYGADQQGNLIEYQFPNTNQAAGQVTAHRVTVNPVAGQTARDTRVLQNIDAALSNGVRHVFATDGTSRVVHIQVNGPNAGVGENISQTIADADRASGYFDFQKPFVGRAYTSLLVLVDPRNGKLFVYGTNGGELILFSTNRNDDWQAANLTNDLKPDIPGRTPGNAVFGGPGGYVLPDGSRFIFQINGRGETVEYFIRQDVDEFNTRNVTLARGRTAQDLACPGGANSALCQQIGMGGGVGRRAEADPVPNVIEVSAELTAADADARDEFGHVVAVDGRTAVVGVPLEDSAAPTAGAAYILTLDDQDNWQQIQKLTADSPVDRDRFGQSVAVSGDLMVVGAHGTDDNGTNSGSVYVFRRTGDEWTQVTQLFDPQGRARDQFGHAVAIDGDTIVVGARLDDGRGTNSGSVFVFERNLGGPDAFGLRKRIKAADAAAGDQFGFSVAIDGDDLIVGSRKDDSDVSTAKDVGSAYFFTRNTGGSENWGQTVKIGADGQQNDWFGQSVALDGDTAVIGKPVRNHRPRAGGASIRTRDLGGSDQWGESAELRSPIPSDGDRFGFSVSLHSDRVLVGAPNDGRFGNSAGAAYRFDRDHGGVESWGHVSVFAGVSNGDALGHNVAVGDDVFVIAAPRRDTDGPRSGSVYMEPITELGGGAGQQASQQQDAAGPVSIPAPVLILDGMFASQRRDDDLFDSL